MPYIAITKVYEYDVAEGCAILLAYTDRDIEIAMDDQEVVAIWNSGDGTVHYAGRKSDVTGLKFCDDGRWTANPVTKKYKKITEKALHDMMIRHLYEFLNAKMDTDILGEEE